PFTETVSIEVSSSTDEPFELQLRIPGWAEDWELSVDGDPVDLDPVDGYVRLHRSWTAAQVRLNLPMRTRVIRRAKQAAALRLGPLTLVHPLGENWRAVDGAPGLDEWEIHRRTSWNWALAGLDRAADWSVERRPVQPVPFGLTGS